MEVLKNDKLKENIFLLTFEDKRLAEQTLPGQFVHIKIKNSDALLLRRPFSVHYVKENVIYVVYKVIGRGTKILSEYKHDDEIDVLGPLGNSFELTRADKTVLYKNVLLVAGGMGIAPLYFVASKVSESGGAVKTLMGAAKEEELVGKEAFEKLGTVAVATEDGSVGTKGLVTDLLKDIEKPEVIFSCGPIGMLKAVQRYAMSEFIPCQLSLEQHMACGFGVCLGCAIPAKIGYKYVCKDGPVFWAEEVKL